MYLSFIWDHLAYSHFFSDVDPQMACSSTTFSRYPHGQKFLNINSNFIFSSSIGNLATWRWLIKKFPRSKTQNSFFADHFRFSGKIWPSLMYTTPFVPHVFSSFLFYQELRIFKNYRAFRFKFPDKKLISLCEFTISLFDCRWFIKICCFSFFRIWSAIAQQITLSLRQYCTSFGVFIRLELEVQLYFHFPLCIMEKKWRWWVPKVKSSMDPVYQKWWYCW